MTNEKIRCGKTPHETNKSVSSCAIRVNASRNYRTVRIRCNGMKTTGYERGGGRLTRHFRIGSNYESGALWPTDAHVR
jgi:hypothetical protein